MCGGWSFVLACFTCVLMLHHPQVHAGKKKKLLLKCSGKYKITRLSCFDRRLWICGIFFKNRKVKNKIEKRPKAARIACWLCHGPIWESCDNKVGIFFSMKKMYCFHVASTLRMKIHSQSPARLNGRGHQAAVWHIVLMSGCMGTSWAFTPTSTHPLLEHMRPD